MTKPIPTTDFIQSHKTGTLDSSLTKEDIDSFLGFESNQEASCDGKVTVGWDFTFGEHKCSIWDYKGSRWSTFGPATVYEELFGPQWQKYR